MIRPEETALVLLAAGRSVRFGAGDKLAADFLGQPLAMHVVTALAAVPFTARIAVVSGTALDFAACGYRVVRNSDPAAGMAGSVRLGVAAARDGGAAAVLIALADMPRVSAAHVLRLFNAAEGAETVVASSDGERPTPPALFGAGRFDVLLGLEGDAGARGLIRAGRHVVASAAELVDVDTVGDLAALRGMVER